jgi:hypothetical protein
VFGIISFFLECYIFKVVVDRVDHLVDDLGLEVNKNFGGWTSMAGIINNIK